jgi:hypothetical protein
VAAHAENVLENGAIMLGLRKKFARTKEVVGGRRMIAGLAYKHRAFSALVTFVRSIRKRLK